MTEEQAPKKDAQDGGKQSDQGRVFTQEEVNQIVAQRLQRAGEKYGDYDDLKAKAERLAELEDAQKTELERAMEAKAQAEAQAQKVLATANERLTRSAFIAEAAKLGVAHPEDTYALADKKGVSVSEDGTVVGVAEAVKTLVDAGRVPMSGKPRAPSTDAGAGGGERSDKVSLSPEQLQAARRMGISPDEYAKYIQKQAREV